MKMQKSFYLEENVNKYIANIKATTGKSMSALINEGIKLIISKYSGKPIDINEAIKKTAGIAKGEIKDMREIMNKNILERAKR